MALWGCHSSYARETTAIFHLNPSAFPEGSFMPRLHGVPTVQLFSYSQKPTAHLHGSRLQFHPCRRQACTFPLPVELCVGLCFRKLMRTHAGSRRLKVGTQSEHATLGEFVTVWSQSEPMQTYEIGQSLGVTSQPIKGHGKWGAEGCWWSHMPAVLQWAGFLKKK